MIASTGIQVIRKLGWRGATEYILKDRLIGLASRFVDDASPRRTYQLSVPGIATALICRHRSSDRYAFGQVFIHGQYACPDPFAHPEYIVDCGANVGFASVYLLHRFPRATVVAVEPDSRNFDILVQNLAPYEPRAVPLHSAIWSHRVRLSIQQSTEEQNEWGTQVKENASEAAIQTVEAIDVPWLLQQSPHGRIDILKIDIEGAEEMIFGQESERWIKQVGMIMIELHGEKNRSLFFKALSSGSFEITQRGEITIARSLNP